MLLSTVIQEIIKFNYLTINNFLRSHLRSILINISNKPRFKYPKYQVASMRTYAHKTMEINI